MFTHQDCILLLNDLKETPDRWPSLTHALNHQVQTKQLEINTVQELRSFMHGFSENEIEPLAQYYLRKEAIRQQFSSIDVFTAFLLPSSAHFSKLNFLFLNHLLRPNTHRFVQTKEDVLAYVNLLCCALNTEEISLFFDELDDSQLASLFKPFQLPCNHFFSKRAEEAILINYDAIREAIPHIYQPNYKPLNELIADLFYEWVKNGYHQANNKLMQEYLGHLARYQRYQEQQIQRYNTFDSYQFPRFEHSHAILVDVDETLITRPDDSQPQYYQRPLIFNLTLIEKLKNGGIPIFLFTDMACHFRNVWERIKIKKFLEAHGVRVIGIITPTDLLADLSVESLQHLQQLQDHEFVTDFLVQAILIRLTDNQFPPTLGKTFADATDFYNAKLANTPLSDNEEEEWRQINEIAEHKDVMAHDRLRAKMCEVIRRIDRSDAAIAERPFTHIKWQMVKQFLIYQTRVQHVDMYDDQTLLLQYIDGFARQFDPNRHTITTHLVTFPPPPHPIYAYYQHFFNTKRAATENKKNRAIGILPTLTKKSVPDPSISKEREDTNREDDLPPINDLRIGSGPK